MKVMFAGDWHGDRDWARTCFKIAKRKGVKLIIQLGDFGYWEHERQGKTYLNLLSEWSAYYGVELIWLDGNHDNHPLLWENYPTQEDGFAHLRPGVRYSPRGNRFTVNGVHFMTVGGAFSVDRDARLFEEQKAGKRGWQWWATETINHDDVARASRPGPVDVMLTHDCPAGIQLEDHLDPKRYKDDWIETRENRRQLRKIVDAVHPKMLIHGHYHQRYSDLLRLEDGWRVQIEGVASNREHTPGQSFVIVPVGDQEDHG